MEVMDIEQYMRQKREEMWKETRGRQVEKCKEAEKSRSGLMEGWREMDIALMASLLSAFIYSWTSQ